MQLVLFLQAAQDRNRILDRRFGDEDRLKAAGQGRVLFDMLAVFVQRRRTYRMQVAARQGRLQHVRRVHRALGGAGADQGVQLVDEQHDVALRRGDLLQQSFQPFFELAAELGARHQRAEVERQ